MTDQVSRRPLSVMEHIYQQLPYLNPTLKRIAEYVLAHPQETKTITIRGLATACGVAESSVTRFVRTIGLHSYQGMKIAIAEALMVNELGKNSEMPMERFVYEDITRENTDQEILENVSRRSIQTVQDTRARLNVPELVRAAGIVAKSKVLVFCSMGSSGIAAEEGVMRFTRVGKKCLLFRDHSLQLMNASILEARDVVIGISNSGRSAPVVESLRLARAKGARTICITSFEDAPIVLHADVKLYTSIKSSPVGAGLYSESMTAKSAQILVIDALYAIFAARSYDRSLQYLEDTYQAAIKDSRAG